MGPHTIMAKALCDLPTEPLIDLVHLGAEVIFVVDSIRPPVPMVPGIDHLLHLIQDRDDLPPGRHRVVPDIGQNVVLNIRLRHLVHDPDNLLLQVEVGLPSRFRFILLDAHLHGVLSSFDGSRNRLAHRRSYQIPDKSQKRRKCAEADPLSSVRCVPQGDTHHPFLFSIRTYRRGSFPTNMERGRISRLSACCSITWAVQPAVREAANTVV